MYINLLFRFIFLWVFVTLSGWWQTLLINYSVWFVCIINAENNLCVYEFLSCFCHCYGVVLHPVKALFPTKSYFCEMIIMINAFHFFILQPCLPWTPIYVRHMIIHKKKTSFLMSWWKYKLYNTNNFFSYNMNKSIRLWRTQFLL